jgi:hypothetical protein
MYYDMCTCGNYNDFLLRCIHLLRSSSKEKQAEELLHSNTPYRMSTNTYAKGKRNHTAYTVCITPDQCYIISRHDNIKPICCTVWGNYKKKSKVLQGEQETCCTEPHMISKVHNDIQPIQTASRNRAKDAMINYENNLNRKK